MAKIPTKNKNLWSDDKLQLEYTSALKSLKETLQMAKEFKAGTYRGTYENVLSVRFLKVSLAEIKERLITVERYIVSRNEFNAKNMKTLIPLVKWNKNTQIAKKNNVVKDRTPEQIENDNALDELFDEMTKEE